jgi:DNA mismatch repair protein MSH3
MVDGKYLVEVRNADVAKVPKNWVKVSGTKAVSRFHSPQIVKLVQEREQRKESLGIECDRAYASFLKYVTH